jgi:integrase
MPRKRLTEQGVAKLNPPPKGKQIDYYDTHLPGLVLRVNYGGAKIWRALYYVKRTGQNGKQVSIPTTFKLGRYPTLKLKEAREAARKFLADPQKAKAKAVTGSFKDVAENFLARHVKANKLRSQYDIERILNNLVYPHWQDRPFAEIRRSDVADLLDIVEDKNGPRQADVMLAVIRKMMNWYATRNDDYSSPVVRGMRRHGQQKRERWLRDDEIRALWTACGDMGTFGALLKTLLFTGQRCRKVTTMKWEDLADGEWRIAREAREKGAAERLHLPQLVLDIVNAQPRLANNPYVFAATVGGGPFNSFSQRKAALDAKLADIEHWQLHDLRRTARKLMTRAGVRVDVAELALGHSIKGIRAHYDDPGEYQPMIDAALQAVANEVERIVNPPSSDNVVNMRPPRHERAR